MITRVDAARICACAEEVETALDKLMEQLSDLLTDDDVASPVYAQIKGAQLKSRAAKKELDGVMSFAVAALIETGGGAR